MSTEPLVDLPVVPLHGDVLAAPGAASPASPAAGASAALPREIIPGYRMVAPIGAGGYGQVWRVEAPGGLAKAAKIVFGHADEKRAADESKALWRIKDVRHPFLLSLERIEVVNHQLIVISELADASLKDRFDQCVAAGQPGIPRAELLGYMAEAADALDFMTSEHGLQHLDIKPENLLLVGGHVKVADFGLVKSVHDVSVSMVGGLTPMFAAPETFDGRPSDRSDQYSLAIVYQLLLTGRCPFDGRTVAQLASQHLNGRPVLESLPDSDRPIIERALSKDPFDRFPNCRALIERLRGLGGSSSFAGPAPAAPSPARPASRGTPRPAAREEFKTEIIEVQNAAAILPADETARRSPTLHGTVRDFPPLSIGDGTAFQPTLLIGVGGCGAKVLRELARRVQARIGSPGNLPSLGWLLIDTDFDGYRSNFSHREESLLEETKFLHTPLKPTAYYRGRADEYTRWLSRRWIYNIPRTLATDGARPLGRLALVDHIDSIDRKLCEELAAIRSPAAVSQSQQTLGRSIDDQHPRIILVGSISSGTGGGMIWDLVQLAHQAFGPTPESRPEIVCLAAHWSFPTAKELELARVNACSSLLELQHYATEGCPGDASCHLPALGRHFRIFDNVYLVNFGALGADESFSAAAGILAQYAEASILSPTAEFIRRCRQTEPADGRPSASLRTFALARIRTDDLAAADEAARYLVKATFRAWLDRSPCPSREGAPAPLTDERTPVSAVPPAPSRAAIASTSAADLSSRPLSELALTLVEASEQHSLATEIVQILDEELRGRPAGPETRPAAASSTTASLSKRSLALARRWMVNELIRRKVEAAQPGLLSCGGDRRFLILASPPLRESGLVERIQKHLPAAATVAEHTQDEILLLCEGDRVPVATVARNITHDRPDLLDLATRIPTRCDVSWASL